MNWIASMSCLLVGILSSECVSLYTKNVIALYINSVSLRHAKLQKERRKMNKGIYCKLASHENAHLPETSLYLGLSGNNCVRQSKIVL